MSAISPYNCYQFFSSLFSQKHTRTFEFSSSSEDGLPDWPWVSLSPDEIKDLMIQLKGGKAPDSDAIPSKILKLSPDWWASSLVSLFTIIDKSGIITKAWLNAIMVLIFKKGEPSIPNNCSRYGDYWSCLICLIWCSLHTPLICSIYWFFALWPVSSAL